MIDKNAILSALEARFDYVSARAVLTMTLKDLKISDAHSLPPEVISHLKSKLPTHGGQFQTAEGRLNALLSGAKPAAAAANPAAAAPIAAAPVVASPEQAEQAKGNNNNNNNNKKK
ncbi:hypothetical protein KKF91_15815 [Myxococcota bacterium]|nr:hypothetical protein [Myxococcota bacterium]MBU1432008.1 hypothetical protein [Myxococcota bacterium]MBU1896174.1 hypothetical protein [Myxococcota bacterium]